MSNGATMSILGLYKYDNTVFDLMQFPEDFTQDQKDTVKYNILSECAELEILYPNPVVMKNMIGIWSKKEVPYWDRIYKASLLEYDPIENYRRNETETIEDSRTEEHSGTDRNTASGSDVNSISNSSSDVNRTTDVNTGSSTSSDAESGTDSTTNKITGYDSNTLVNHDSSEISYGHTTTNTASGTNSQQHDSTTTNTTTGSNTQQYGRIDSMQHGEKIEHGGATERTVLAFGNIGTMTSQDMLTQETEVAKIVQVVPIIIESFKDRFCLMVY